MFEVYLHDLLLELRRILDHPDAFVDVVLEAIDIRSQIASLTNTPAPISAAYITL